MDGGSPTDNLSPPLSDGVSKVRWRAVLPAFVTVTVSILPGFLTAGLAVQMRDDIGLSLTGLGISLGAFFGVSGVASPIMGAIVQRAGWSRGLRLSALLAATTLAGIAWRTPSPVALAAWFALGGLAASLGQPAANLAIARCVPKRRQGLLFGMKHASVPAATLVAGLAVPAVALTVGWTWAFWGSAVIALGTALTVPWQPGGASAPARSRDPRRLSTPLPLLVALGLAAVLGIGGIDALASFVVSYAVTIGIDPSTAGLLLAAGSSAGITARLVAGWVIDRMQHAGLTAVASMLVTGAAGVIGIAAGAQPGLLIGGLVGFAAGWGWSGLFTFAIVKDNPDAPATATGITQTGVFVGAAIGPALFGAVAEAASFTTSWWLTAGSLLAAAVIVLLVRARLRRIPSLRETPAQTGTSPAMGLASETRP